MSFMNAPLPPAVPGAAEHPSLALIGTLFATPGNDAVELLDGPVTTAAWLVEHGLVPDGTQLQDYCHAKLTTLRSQLRHLFDAHLAQQTPEAEVLAEVNAAIRVAPQTLTLIHEPGRGFTRVTGHPVTQLVEHAMARIAEDAAALLAEEKTAASLERCGAPSCDRVFLRTHARRHWCSTRCGDRVRAARAYAKKKQTAAS